MLLLWSTCSRAIAIEPPQRPDFERQEPAPQVVTANGTDWVCYTPAQGKQLKHVLVDYHTLWKLVLFQEQLIASLELEIEDWSARTDLWRESSDYQRERGDGLLETWKTERAMRIQLERSSNEYDWVPWALLVASNVGLGVFAAISASR